MTFTANGEHLVGGGEKAVRVWQVKDGKQVATMPIRGREAWCVAASRDGRWIAAGTDWGSLLVWDKTAYEQVFAGRTGLADIDDVDFSPGSSRLVSAADNGTATIWALAAPQKVQTLDHWNLHAAKYSPQGDRIATASDKLVCVWDSSDGKLLVDIDVQVNGLDSLLWCKKHLFVQGDNKIKEINAATGSTVSEWLVPRAQWPCIALPRHGKFIGCTVDDGIFVWDTATQSQLGFIPHTEETGIRSSAFSPDNQLLAIVGEREIIVKGLVSQSVSVRSMSCL